MPKLGAKATLTENVKLLMSSRYGGVNISRFGQETGLSNGGTQRILDPESDIRVEQLNKIAAAFGIEVWQLLAPNLGQAMLLSPAELEAVRKIREPLQPRPVNPPSENLRGTVVTDSTAPRAPARKVAR